MNVLLYFAPHIVVEIRYSMRVAPVFLDAVHNFVIVPPANLPITFLVAGVGAPECSFVTTVLLVRHPFTSKLTRHAIATLAQIVVANVFWLAGLGMLFAPACRRIVLRDVGHGDVLLART